VKAAATYASQYALSIVPPRRSRARLSLGDSLEVFGRRDVAERFIEEVRGNDSMGLDPP
jgi:hypothetical protein